jgi:hypothetical protein
MRNLKAILFIFIPLMALLFVQAEKNHLHKIQQNAFQSYDDSGVDIADDDSISFPIDDDDLDDSPESAVKHISGCLVCFAAEIHNPDYQFARFRTSDRVAAYRNISPSFLKVFRI